MTVRGSLPRFYQAPIQYENDAEKQARKINHRLERLEQAQKNLRTIEKWPIQKSLDLNLFKQLKRVPKIVIHPPSSSPISHISSSVPSVPSPRTLQRLLQPASTHRSAFPFPVTSGDWHTINKDRPFIECSFIYFQFLPAELRLQIWEIELRRPKFIEAQFSSQFYVPTFVGACTKGSVLKYVCRESRELALSVPWQVLRPRQRTNSMRSISHSFSPDIPLGERPLLFRPNDTIFFRSLDRVQGGLRSLATGVGNFEMIQHLALPLPPAGLGLRNEWKRTLSLFQNLKTLTFLVGGKDQSWVQEGDIELRDFEEWFLDGRPRSIKMENWILDVGEVGSYLGGLVFEERMKGSWDRDWKGINVRCVAWKKCL